MDKKHPRSGVLNMLFRREREEPIGSALTRGNSGSRSCAWREGFQPFPPYNLPVGMGTACAEKCALSIRALGGEVSISTKASGVENAHPVGRALPCRHVPPLRLVFLPLRMGGVRNCGQKMQNHAESQYTNHVPVPFLIFC